MVECLQLHSAISFETFQLKLGMFFVLLIVIESNLEMRDSRAHTRQILAMKNCAFIGLGRSGPAGGDLQG